MVKIQDFFDPAMYPSLDDSYQRDLGEKYMALNDGIHDLDGEHDGVRLKLRQYASSVTKVCEKFDSGIETVEVMKTDLAALATLTDSLLSHIPFQATFRMDHSAATTGERWMSENLVGKYDMYSVNDFCVVIFERRDDWTLFKVNYAV